jgi:hypothetical protein
MEKEIQRIQVRWKRQPELRLGISKLLALKAKVMNRDGSIALPRLEGQQLWPVRALPLVLSYIEYKLLDRGNNGARGCSPETAQRQILLSLGREEGFAHYAEAPPTFLQSSPHSQLSEDVDNDLLKHASIHLWRGLHPTPHPHPPPHFQLLRIPIGLTASRRLSHPSKRVHDRAEPL